MYKRQGNTVPIPAPKPIPYQARWNPEHIGVTTSDHSLDEMSGMDRLLASQFNPVWQKYGRVSRNYESFAYRTAADRNILRQFDPIYNSNESVREAYAPSGCSGIPGHSHLFDDPYQPYSYSVTYPGQH